MQASPLLMYVAALNHGSKKYTTYELMISCCLIGNVPVCCLFLPRTGTSPHLFIASPNGPPRPLAIGLLLVGEPAEFGKNRTLSLNAGTGRPLRLGSENEASERLRLNVPQLLFAGTPYRLCPG